MAARWPNRRAMIVDLALAVAAGAFDIFVYQVTRIDTNGSFRTGPLPPEPLVVTLYAVAAASLILRRRWPVQVFVFIWLISMTPAVFPILQPFMALLVVMFTVASTFGRRPAVWSLVATSVVFGVEIVGHAPADPKPISFVTSLIINGLLVVAVWVAARLRWRVVHRIAGIERRRAEEIRTAVRRERLSVSRDLHDIVSHSVSAMTLQAAGVRAVMDQQPDRIRPALEAIEQTGIQAMNELQRLLQVLRSDADYVEPTHGRDRLSQLPELIERARETGQRVELEVSGDPSDLDPSVEMTCYRVIQEALNNAGRHAGSGATVKVRLEWLPARLQTIVINDLGFEDNGQQPSLSTGHGLIGLAERVQLVGGELETGPLPEGGFRIRATLPVVAPSTNDTTS